MLEHRHEKSESRTLSKSVKLLYVDEHVWGCLWGWVGIKELKKQQNHVVH